MPKDEFDFEDPLELNGMAFATDEDTTEAMCECFVEEFMRMGYNAQQILGLFRNQNYLGPNMALQKQGEARIREGIAEVFARWGRTAEWHQPATPPPPQTVVLEEHARDPLGAPIPHFKP